MRFRVPKHTTFKLVRDADYSEVRIRYDAEGGPFYLKSMAGPLVARAKAFEDLRKGSVVYSESILTSQQGRKEGLGTRGTFPSVTKWRWVGPTIGEMVSYEGASDEAARFFDAIIGSMCFDDTAPPIWVAEP
jgi:hypothetical protein